MGVPKGSLIGFLLGFGKFLFEVEVSEPSPRGRLTNLTDKSYFIVEIMLKNAKAGKLQRFRS